VIFGDNHLALTMVPMIMQGIEPLHPFVCWRTGCLLPSVRSEFDAAAEVISLVVRRTIGIRIANAFVVIVPQGVLIRDNRKSRQRSNGMRGQCEWNVFSISCYCFDSISISISISSSGSGFGSIHQRGHSRRQPVMNIGIDDVSACPMAPLAEVRSREENDGWLVIRDRIGGSEWVEQTFSTLS